MLISLDLNVFLFFSLTCTACVEYTRVQLIMQRVRNAYVPCVRVCVCTIHENEIALRYVIVVAVAFINAAVTSLDRNYKNVLCDKRIDVY